MSESEARVACPPKPKWTHLQAWTSFWLTGPGYMVCCLQKPKWNFPLPGRLPSDGTPVSWSKPQGKGNPRGLHPWSSAGFLAELGCSSF